MMLLLQGGLDWRRSGRGCAIQRTWQSTVQDDLQPNSKAGSDVEIQVRPDLFRLLEEMGVDGESIPMLIEEAQRWWRQVGSHKSGKLVIQAKDFHKHHAESVLMFMTSKGVKLQ